MSSNTASLTPAQSDGLEAHVDAVTLSLQALAVLLIRERDALTARAGAEALERVAEDKQSAVEQVSALYALLRKSLEPVCGAASDFPASLLSLERSHPRLAERVQRLVALTRECQRANQDNGVLVSAGLHNARCSLETLREMSTVPGEAGTYGRGAEPWRAAAGDRLAVRA